MLGGVFMLSSCKGLVEDLNDDPNNFTDATPELLLNQAMLNMSSIGESDPARIAAMFSDQMTGCDRQYTSYNNYNVTSNNFDAIWGDVYQRGITQAQLAKVKAEAEGNTIFAGIATILEAYYFGEAAALFGDVPFSEVNNVSKFPDPTYEGQMSVLTAVQAMLDDGIANAGAYGTTTGNSIFSSTATWDQIGYALKARYYLLAKNYAAAQTAVENSDFSTPGQALKIIHTTANFSENLFWQFEAEQRGGYLCWDGSYLWRMLQDTEDAYRGNAKTDESVRFAYYASGPDMNISNDGLFAVDRDFPIISFEEMVLTWAEATLRVDAANAPDALDALNAVRDNWNTELGASVYSNYDMADFDMGGIANTQNEAPADALLREILEEKYISVIGLPTFYDVNRTKNMLGVPIKNTNTTVVPQRFLYPSTESSSNANFPGLEDLFLPTEVNQ